MYAVLRGDHKYPLYQTSDGKFKFCLTLHVNEAMPAHEKHFANDINDLMDILDDSWTWREPTEDDEADGDVLLIAD